MVVWQRSKRRERAVLPIERGPKGELRIPRGNSTRHRDASKVVDAHAATNHTSWRHRQQRKRARIAGVGIPDEGPRIDDPALREPMTRRSPAGGNVEDAAVSGIESGR